MTSSLLNDKRGVANRIIIFGLIIIAIAMMMAVLNPAFDRVHNESEALADTTNATTGLEYVDAFWTYIPFIGLMLGVASLMAGALFESRRGVR